MKYWKSILWWFLSFTCIYICVWGLVEIYVLAGGPVVFISPDGSDVLVAGRVEDVVGFFASSFSESEIEMIKKYSDVEVLELFGVDDHLGFEQYGILGLAGRLRGSWNYDRGSSLFRWYYTRGALYEYDISLLLSAETISFLKGEPYGLGGFDYLAANTSIKLFGGGVFEFRAVLYLVIVLLLQIVFLVARFCIRCVRKK